MKRIAKWLMAGIVITGIAVPKIAYACLPPPIYWQATITEVELKAVNLPEGLRITPIQGGIEIDNRTNHDVLIGKTADKPVQTIKPDTAIRLTKSDLYDAFFPDDYGNDGIHWGDEKPELSNEIPLVFYSDEQRYEIPATLTYALAYHDSDGGGSCGLTYLFQFLSVICPFLLFVGAVVAVITAIRNKRAAA